MKRQSAVVLPFPSVRTPCMQLPFAFPPDVKAAHVSALPPFENVEAYPRASWDALPTFEPRVLVGYSLDLQRLAASVMAGQAKLTTVDHAIFVLSDCGARTASDVLRVTLWQTFGVPVYELIVAPGCRLLASECEAHDGWHLQPGLRAYFRNGELVCDLPPHTNLHTGLGGQIDEAPCACGRPTIRLKNLNPHPPRPAQNHLAAVA